MAGVVDDTVGGAVVLVNTAVADVAALLGPTNPSTIATTTAHKTTSSSTTSATKPTKTESSPAATSPSSSGNSSGNSGTSDNGSEHSNGGGSSNDGSNVSSVNSSRGSDPVTSDDTSGSSSSGSASGANSSIGGGGGDASPTSPGSNSVSLAVSAFSTSVGSSALPSSDMSFDSLSSSDFTGSASGNTDSATASGTAASPSAIILNVAKASSTGISDNLDSSSGVQGTVAITSTSVSTSGVVDSRTTGSVSNGGGNGSSDASQASGKGISPGVIAAIAIVAGLALAAVLVLGIRKWNKNRRALRLHRWAENSGNGGAFALFSGGDNANKENEKRDTSGTQSARSSFGTTFDQGLRPFTPGPLPSVVPTPLLEPSVSSVSVFYTPRASVTPDSMSANVLSPVTLQRPAHAAGVSRRPSDRSSVFHIESENLLGGCSDDGSHSACAQYLFAPPLDAPGAPQLSPISVRPWSPSERWAFPKPPSTAGATSMFASPSACSMPVVSKPASPVPTLLSNAESVGAQIDPFADPDPASLTAARRTPVASPALSDSAVTARTSAWDAHELGSTPGLIKRPFIPTLTDELAVQRGDQIRVLQRFDDGWVQVEKTDSAETGLIPVDCLREEGEALPAFMAARRVSSYYGGAIAL